ncbi:nuclear transport factor 2 family protein [Roseibium sp. RKSG952]|uniref:nuclear transport factor 2 family protein n=1 Tax=Roseibium sp. RKSG952 TaxID=2529384 RepID=UPI0012BBD2B2|nr:nuclear transport factor 2 family protein [Roseibium sp. RKSG952]MTH97036.1 nuclear transport factor 2 family protein [Roseibium sp. RKSG952]
MSEYSAGLKLWLSGLEGGDKAKILNDILADDCVFISPVLHTPQKGKQLTFMYLYGAMTMLLEAGNFKYTRILEQGPDAILEFETELDGLYINGVDMMTFNEEGKIIEFKVMLRPLKALEAASNRMMKELQKVS